jgi:hypothetical protein
MSGRKHGRVGLKTHQKRTKNAARSGRKRGKVGSKASHGQVKKTKKTSQNRDKTRSKTTQKGAEKPPPKSYIFFRCSWKNADFFTEIISRKG